MIEPRFTPGQRVRIAYRNASGHCRTPFYLRGKPGVIETLIGRFRNPEQLAYHRPGLPMNYLYRVSFEQSALWRDYQGQGDDQVAADIFEHWLEDASDSRQ